MPIISFTAFPQLATARLLLRQPLALDAPQLFELRSHPEVNKYLDRPAPVSMDDVHRFIDKINTGIAKKEWLYWVIVLQDTDQLIGTVCLWNLSQEKNSAEIGYELLPNYRGKGFMREAVTPVLRFGFDTMQLSTIEAWTRADNEASVSLLKYFHFRLQIHSQNITAGTSPEDPDNMVMYALSLNNRLPGKH
jgi:ribosomal-protein-alanine N-acetyltransferase